MAAHPPQLELAEYDDAGNITATYIETGPRIDVIVSRATSSPQQHHDLVSRRANCSSIATREAQTTFAPGAGRVPARWLPSKRDRGLHAVRPSVSTLVPLRNDFHIK